MPIGPNAAGLWFDFAEPDWTAATITTAWHNSAENFSPSGFGRAELEANTIDYIVERMAAGAWQLAVSCKLRPATIAMLTAWDAAVIAGAAISYRWIMQRGIAISATNIAFQGSVLPTKMLLGQSNFAGLTETDMTLQPSGVTPYVGVEYSTGVFTNYGDL